MGHVARMGWVAEAEVTGAAALSLNSGAGRARTAHRQRDVFVRRAVGTISGASAAVLAAKVLSRGFHSRRGVRSAMSSLLELKLTTGQSPELSVRCSIYCGPCQAPCSRFPSAGCSSGARVRGSQSVSDSPTVPCYALSIDVYRSGCLTPLAALSVGLNRSRVTVGSEVV